MNDAAFSRSGRAGFVGTRIRRFRQDRGWSLQQLSELSGVPLSTLGKVETNELSLPVDRLFRIADAFAVPVTDFFDTEKNVVPPVAIGRRSIIRRGEGRSNISGSYDCQWLFADLFRKGMIPVIQTISVKTLAEFGPLLRHEGEEFTLVLSGRVAFHSDIYEPEILNERDGIYIDSRMGHAYLNAGEEAAVFLNVTTDVTLF